MKKLVATLALLAPTVALAQYNARVTDFNSGVAKFTGISNAIIGILIGIAVLYIIYNILMFIMKAATDDRKTYQSGIIWGIVGLAIILSIWGLVFIITNTFGTSGGVTPTGEFPVVTQPPLVR